MVVEIITRDDLEKFRFQLLEDIKVLIQSKQQGEKKWLRSGEVRKLLKISSSTLQNLRVTGKLHPSKIGGIMYYNYDEIEKLLIKQNGQ